MVAAILKPLSRCLVTNFRTASIPPILHNALDHFANRGKLTIQENLVRNYAKKTGHVCDGCRRAFKDIPEYVDRKCPLPCKAKKTKKKGILYKIKFKIMQGGSNFGTPFRKLLFKDECRDKVDKKPEKKMEEPAKEKAISLPPPKKLQPVSAEPRRGVQVSILGADTTVGQYVALLLKQNPHVKKLRLYQSRVANCSCPPGNITDPCRDMFNITQDLQHIDTNCVVQAFTCCSPLDLNLSLQNADIVLMLDDGSAHVNMPFEQRFECQAPKVKMYADAISHECPKAIVIVGTTPVDCMVPLVAETLKETGWYDKRKLIGSMAVPEMRASTLAARALSLEPRTTRVPCVGGTEGLMLVPLFSKTVTYFDFERRNAEMLTETVRMAPLDVTRCECCCLRSADLSEAHALSNLVKNVATAILCQDIPRISGFVETDSSQIISPARYLGLEVLINRHGICKVFDLPASMSNFELDIMDLMWEPLVYSVNLAENWCHKTFSDQCIHMGTRSMKNFHIPGKYERIENCNCYLSS